MIWTRCFMLIALWGLSLSIALKWGGFVFWFIVHTTTFVLIYAFLYYVGALRHIEFQHSLIRHDQGARVERGGSIIAGDAVTVSITFRYRSWLPLSWIIVQERWFHHVEQLHFYFRKWVFPWWNGEFSLKYTMENVKRGRYEYIDTEFITGDLFGLLQKRKKQTSPYTEGVFTVYPRALKVKDGLSSKGVLTEVKAVTFAHLESPAHIRDYVEGDPLRFIDWKASAKGAGFKTRSLESSQMFPFFVCLEDAQSAYEELANAGGIFESGVQIAAGFIDYGASKGYHVQLHGGGAHEQDPYHRLANVVIQPKSRLVETVLEVFTRFDQGAIFICITPRLEARWLLIAERARSRGIQLRFVYLYDSAAIPWHESQLLKSLEKLDCGVIAVPYTPHEGNNQQGAEEIV